MLLRNKIPYIQNTVLIVYYRIITTVNSIPNTV